MVIKKQNHNEMKIILIIIIGIVIINYSFKYKQVKEEDKQHHYVKAETQDTPKKYLTEYAPQVFEVSLLTSIHSIYNQVILPIGGIVVITAGLMSWDIFKRSK